VLVYDPCGPLYLVRVVDGDTEINIWSQGMAGEILEWAARLGLVAEAQQMTTIDDTVPAVRCREV